MSSLRHGPFVEENSAFLDGDAACLCESPPCEGDVSIGACRGWSSQMPAMGDAPNLAATFQPKTTAG